MSVRSNWFVVLSPLPPQLFSLVVISITVSIKVSNFYYKSTIYFSLQLCQFLLHIFSWAPDPKDSFISSPDPRDIGLLDKQVNHGSERAGTYLVSPSKFGAVELRTEAPAYQSPSLAPHKPFFCPCFMYLVTVG